MSHAQSLQDEVQQLKAQLDRLSALFPTDDRCLAHLFIPSHFSLLLLLLLLLLLPLPSPSLPLFCFRHVSTYNVCADASIVGFSAGESESLDVRPYTLCTRL